jgi:hypothetical protein
VEGLISILTDLSQVLGVPAAICLAWAAFVIRDHGKRISELENSQKSEVNAIYDRLNDIAQDVAFIKGRMEGEK